MKYVQLIVFNKSFTVSWIKHPNKRIVKCDIITYTLQLYRSVYFLPFIQNLISISLLKLNNSESVLLIKQGSFINSIIL